MSSILRQVLPALALFCSISAHAAAYPTADELRAAIEVAAGLTQTDGLTLEMKDARQSGVTLPLMAAGLNLNSGVCQIYYNPAPEPGLARFFEGVSAKNLPVWLSAIAVHEATHCIEQREGYLRGHFDEVLPPEIERSGMTLKGYLRIVKSGAVDNWGEALADIASVMYLKQAAPDQWKSFAQAIIAMRQTLAAKWPSHDTSPWLKNLLAVNDDTPRQLSCFDAAFRWRRLLRPQLDIARAASGAPAPSTRNAQAPVAAVSLTVPR